MTFVMIDTQAGNLRSVANAFDRIGVEVRVTTHREDVEKAAAIILPGVGAFAPAMERLNTQGMTEVLRRRGGEEGTPILGICLGMQLLAEASEENGHHAGLGLIGGNVVKLQPRNGDRVPNIGWCDLSVRKAGNLFATQAETEVYYFVHGYYFDCVSADDVAATIEHGGREIPVAVERDNIFGVQFHPEKSQDAGLDLLERVTQDFHRRIREQGK